MGKCYGPRGEGRDYQKHGNDRKGKQRDSTQRKCVRLGCRLKKGVDMWYLVGLLLFIGGILWMMYRDAKEMLDSSEDYFNDVPPPGMGGQV